MDIKGKMQKEMVRIPQCRLHQPGQVTTVPVMVPLLHHQLLVNHQKKCREAVMAENHRRGAEIHQAEEAVAVHQAEKAVAVHQAEEAVAVHQAEEAVAIHQAEEAVAVHQAEEEEAVHQAEEEEAVADIQ
jgi:hypothetical protein